MIRAAAFMLAGSLLCASLLTRQGLTRQGWAQSATGLAAPGNYSFAPASNPAAPASGEASVFVGSRATSGASIQMQSGLLGDTGLRGFVALGGASGRGFPVDAGGSDARVTTQGGAIGVQKSFADGTTISLAGGWSHASVQGGRYTSDLLP